MSFLRSIVSDLVERRLWPIAVALVAALVAVPLVLAKSPAPTGGSAASAPAPATTPSGAPPAGSAVADGTVVTVASGSLGDAPLGGHAKDPFRQQHVPRKAPTASGPVNPAPQKTSTGAGGGHPLRRGGSGSSGGGAAPTKPKLYVVAHVDVRFGPAAGTLKSIDDIPRLAPLPSVATPIVVFLGVRSDERTAVFLVSTDVRAQGDGACKPSRKDCEKVYLKQGQTEILDVTADNGAVTEYELDLVDVTVTHTTSKAKAQAARAHNSRASRHLLQAAASARSVGTLSVRP